MLSVAESVHTQDAAEQLLTEMLPPRLIISLCAPYGCVDGWWTGECTHATLAYVHLRLHVCTHYVLVEPPGVCGAAYSIVGDLPPQFLLARFLLYLMSPEIRTV